MEKYTKAQMEVIEFEAEDVIMTSGASIPIGKCPFDQATGCPLNNPGCTDYTIWGD